MPKIIATSQGGDRSGYDAESAHRMGMVNAVVPHADLENVGLEWAAKICGKSPTAQRMLKFAFNAIDDVLIGQQVFAGRDHATGVHAGVFIQCSLSVTKGPKASSSPSQQASVATLTS